MHLIYLLEIGTWGDWQGWDACSVTCGGGFQGRTRNCTWPDERNKGEHCDVNGFKGTDQQPCSEIPCEGLKLNI